MGLFLTLAVVAALKNWFAVATDNKVLEYVAKPATTLLLLFAALAVDTPQESMRAFVVAALVFCLAGDVFLMLPRDLFVPGLVSFLIAHLLFVVAFGVHEPRYSVLGTGVAAVVVFPFLATPIARAVQREEPKLLAPVIVYAIVITYMFGVSAATGSFLAMAGAAVFVASDTILARNKFVRPMKHGRLATMVTYHAALLLLVLSLR